MNGHSLLLGYYGDDFTGSTDALEALVRNGIPTVLFMAPPSAQDLERFAHVRAIGIAGVARSLPPDALEAELLPALLALQRIGVRIAHYKICSTFDSSPEIGNIGSAIELARRIYNVQPFVPLLAGVPQLGRYTVFGHHYARFQSDTYRLDRHPVMSRHPVTPMDEADLRVHLGQQTDLSIALMDVLELMLPFEAVNQKLRDKLAARPDIVLFDVLHQRQLETIGKLLWTESAAAPLFAIGSSGIEYALAAHWQEAGLAELGGSAVSRGSVELTGLAGSVEQTGGLSSSLQPAGPIAVLSGSCSATTAGQIRYAEQHGFAVKRVPLDDMFDPLLRQQSMDRLADWSSKQLTAGKSVILYTAMGPEDENIGTRRRSLTEQGDDDVLNTGSLLGQALGKIGKVLVTECGVRRLAVAGGDTSGYVVRELGIRALEMVAPLAPGGPLCSAYADNARLDGVELALKGGQVGQADYFTTVRDVWTSSCH